MGNNEAYWLPICELATRLRCWERLSANDGRARWITDWHMLLSIPTPGYLEVGEGPVPIRQVEWVELSTLRVRGGIAGRPRQVVDIADDVASNLRQTATIWEFRDTTWSLEGIFKNEPLRVVHVVNPFWRGPGRQRT
jgi:hypothetical protein